MRNVLSSCRKNPNQKFYAIQDFTAELFEQKAFKEWDIMIEAEPIEITSQILPSPTI